MRGAKGAYVFPWWDFVTMIHSAVAFLWYWLKSKKSASEYWIAPWIFAKVKATKFGLGDVKSTPPPYFFIKKKARLGNRDNLSYSTAPNISSAMLTQVIETPPDLEPLAIIYKYSIQVRSFRCNRTGRP
jgi:hypothetical protein